MSKNLCSRHGYCMYDRWTVPFWVTFVFLECSWWYWARKDPMTFQKCFRCTPFEIYWAYHVVMRIKSLWGFATSLQEQMVGESLQEWSSYYWLWLFPVKKKSVYECLHVCICTTCLQCLGNQTPWNWSCMWLWTIRWTLGAELRTSAKVMFLISGPSFQVLPL